MSKSNILIGITGSIAAYKVCELISRWTQQGHQVRIAASENALRFIGESTLEGLSGHPVFTNVYSPGQAMDHIEWARWADVFLIAPMTANSLGRLASGLAESPLENLFLARDNELPVFLAPAMNVKMYENTIVQENLKKLTDLPNVSLIAPDSGNLACGEIGSGRLADIEKIHQKVFLSPKNRPKILVTSGGTREPIDDVRYISNFSTGQTGANIADHLSRKGYSVTYLHGIDAAATTQANKAICFSSFQDLREKLRKLLAEEAYHGVVHLAAVSDYSPKPISGKISSAESLELKLFPNEKILSRLREFSLNKNIKVIGFKLTSTLDESEKLSAVKKLFKNSEPDFVVQNDLSEVSKANHRFRIFNSKDIVATGNNKPQLSQQVADILGASL